MGRKQPHVFDRRSVLHTPMTASSPFGCCVNLVSLRFGLQLPENLVEVRGRWKCWLKTARFEMNMQGKVKCPTQMACEVVAEVTDRERERERPGSVSGPGPVRHSTLRSAYSLILIWHGVVPNMDAWPKKRGARRTGRAPQQWASCFDRSCPGQLDHKICGREKKAIAPKCRYPRCCPARPLRCMSIDPDESTL